MEFKYVYSGMNFRLLWIREFLAYRLQEFIYYDERVLTLKWKSGTKEAKRGTVPLPIDTNQVGKSLGTLLAFGKTYSALNQLARDWHPFTNWATG